jgi:hemolysin activation/secretion protein
VGRQYQVSLGWSSEALGASADQLAFFARYGDTLRVNTRELWTVDTFARGYWSPNESAFENLWWQGETRYHWRQGERWTAFARLRANYADGLTGENQLTLGGHNGLRGYDVHYQVGDRSVLFNLEQRYYSDWHPFRLVRVGAAVFLDVGRAWYNDRDNGSNGGVLSNAGFGLRFNSSRAEKSSVVHVDFAFPFQRDDDVDSFQVLFTVRDTF